MVSHIWCVRVWPPALLVVGGIAETWEGELSSRSLLLPRGWRRALALLPALDRPRELVVWLVSGPLGCRCECQGKLGRAGRDGEGMPSRVVKRPSLARGRLVPLP